MARENTGSQKLGSTALAGYWRQGLAELRAAAPLAESSIAQPTNYAMPGMATPGEVTAEREGSALGEPEVAAVSKDRQIEQPDRERDDPGLDL